MLKMGQCLFNIFVWEDIICYYIDNLAPKNTLIQIKAIKNVLNGGSNDRKRGKNSLIEKLFGKISKILLKS